MYGIFTYICPKNHPNVGKYSIHGAYGYSSTTKISQLNAIERGAQTQMGGKLGRELHGPGLFHGRYGGFLRHGGASMNGWFISWRIRKSHGWFRGTPTHMHHGAYGLFQETSILPSKLTKSWKIAIKLVKTLLTWHLICPKKDIV